MNKILKVLALGAMALSTTACSDFLEVNPRTQVSETEFYKTEDDMMKVVLYHIRFLENLKMMKVHQILSTS